MEHLPLAEGLDERRYGRTAPGNHELPSHGEIALRPGSLPPDTPLKGGDFVIHSLIGGGGFGAVYRARQPRLERDVAIKVLHPGLASHKDMVERFRREALSAASLAHPHVLAVYDFDFDQEQGMWFLAMRYVDGASSLEHLTPPLDFDLAMGVIAGIASALDAAHARSIVHRDVKPANVLMDGNWPLLTDFGIAHLANADTLTGTGVAIGTPAYMSPEQALGKDVGPASDQYSLAVMAYHLLTGRTPFKGDTPAILYQHVHETPPSPSTINRALSPAAAEVILCAMRKEPGERFASCTEFASTLSEAVRGRAITSSAAAAVLQRSPGPPTPTPETIALTGPAAPASETVVAATTPTGIPQTATSPRQGLSVRTAVIGLGAAIAVAAVAIVAVVLTRGGPTTATTAGGPTGAGAPPSRPGTILLSDDFDDPSRAMLQTSSTDPRYRLAYVGGEYEIAGHAGNAFLPDVYRDATVSVDARLVGDTTGRYVAVACRASAQGWYIMTIYPDSGRFDLEKVSGTGAHTALIPERQAPAILSGNTRNHVDLTCSGDTIEVAINGTPVGSVRDATYADGWFMIMTGAAQGDDSAEAVLRLDNLVVRQR